MIIPAQRESGVIYRAKWVVADADTVYENGFIRVENGLIADIGTLPRKSEGPVIDYGDGAIVPSFVNAHTHLELSAFKNRISFEGGFREWVNRLITLRSEAGYDVLKAGFDAGLSELAESGCAVVGEIATLGSFKESFFDSGVNGVYFYEYLGNSEPDLADFIDHETLNVSVAGHAPHTTAPGLIKFLKQYTLNKSRPFSIHLSESDAEEDFIRTGRGEWADYLTQRGIDYNDWPVTPKGPVSYLDSLGVFDPGTIAVHLLNADTADIKTLTEKGVHLCLCPRSNQNLHGRLPDADKMYQKGAKICLGTDSLASTQNLSMIDEMAFFTENFPSIPPEAVFSMATLNGANALGLGNQLGTLHKGKNASCAFLGNKTLLNSSVLGSLIK